MTALVNDEVWMSTECSECGATVPCVHIISWVLRGEDAIAAVARLDEEVLDFRTRYHALQRTLVAAESKLEAALDLAGELLDNIEMAGLWAHLVAHAKARLAALREEK